jgi:hypothetical protein
MPRTEIAPALSLEEWERRTTDSVSVERVGDEVQVVVHDPDDQLVSVSGPYELFGLIALANDALPDGDMRKITPHIVELLRRAVVLESHHEHPPSPDAIGTGELHAFATVLESLLPPTQ